MKRPRHAQPANKCHRNRPSSVARRAILNTWLLIQSTDPMWASTDEPAEQSRAIGSGGWGGKRADQGEHLAITHALDAARGRRVAGIAGCATSSTGKEARTVHGSAAPFKRRSATGKLLRSEAASGTRGGRHLAGRSQPSALPVLIRPHGAGPVARIRGPRRVLG